MCFHLDQEISSFSLMSNSLKFSTMSTTMIFMMVKQDLLTQYTTFNRTPVFLLSSFSYSRTKYQAMDGIRGVGCAGTRYYLNRKALYCRPNHESSYTILYFFLSRFTFFTPSANHTAKSLATCTFEENTEWGNQIGYSYECLLESTFTGYLTHSKGWKPVYLYPKRPAFKKKGQLF
ncbi:unnamed protein product [Coffea canephora]|uniref:Uncharacterized protein n=1 Tax=Coffea canephora TaxID=49390 RepID=A0A068UHV5_COFCA|nr:unnamed protein product [Coffea canephora]